MKSQVLIKSSCKFIEIGIEQLLASMPENNKTNSDMDISVYNKDSSILPLSGYDAIFLTFFREDYTPEYLLTLIGHYLPNLSDNCKVIIITDSIYSRVLKKYILNFSDSCLVLDASTSINELKDKIISFFNKENNLHNNKKIKQKMKLSERERTVLYHLLKGKDMKCIASQLGIKYKTVSSHKRSGLLKFGFRSLHSFVMPKNRLNTFN